MWGTVTSENTSKELDWKWGLECFRMPVAHQKCLFIFSRFLFSHSSDTLLKRLCWFLYLQEEEHEYINNKVSNVILLFQYPFDRPLPKYYLILEPADHISLNISLNSLNAILCKGEICVRLLMDAHTHTHTLDPVLKFYKIFPVQHITSKTLLFRSNK